MTAHKKAAGDGVPQAASDTSCKFTIVVMTKGK